MCGIAGIVYRDGRRPDLRLLKKMTDTLVHRGPDGEGHVVLDGCGLGHRRLSVIDLETGAQPMANEDDSVWITYNGEVYNYPELQSELERKGHRFRTRSDTESILHLYEEVDDKVVDRLRGMFAFGIWDLRSRKLLLARDRIGKKPLFWFEDSAGIYFASEIKALLTLPNCPREIDHESIDLYLAYQSIPGTKTIFREIHRLAPASRLVWTPSSSASVKRYWQLDWSRKTNISYEEAKIRLRELILDATRCRLISDVPLGAFLSGGIDSSVVVSAMAETSDVPVKTFSIGFPEADFTETRYARLIAKRFGTEHEEFIVEPSAMEILPRLVWHFDQPYADSSALPVFYVSQMARQRVTVALNGDGGDEFFGGYEHYRAVLYQRLYSSLLPQRVRDIVADFATHLPEGPRKGSVRGKIKRFAKASRYESEHCHLNMIQVFGQEARAALYSSEFAAHLDGYNADTYLLGLMTNTDNSRPIQDPMDRILRADTLMYLPDTLLTKMDIASMAVSLEGRSPLLDTSVMEFAASLPSTWKIGPLSSKRILKDAYRGILPSSIIRRPKMGFKVPLERWFRGDLYNYLREVLLDKPCLERGYFRETSIRRLIDEHKTGHRDNSARLWSLLMLELWHKKFTEV